MMAHHLDGPTELQWYCKLVTNAITNKLVFGGNAIRWEGTEQDWRTFDTKSY